MQRKHSALADLLPNVDTSLNKFVGDHKKKLDRAYIVWCCKSSRPLTMAEKDPHFRTFLHSDSNGRYSVRTVVFVWLEVFIECFDCRS